jgi:hypothetical protein
MPGRGGRQPERTVMRKKLFSHLDTATKIQVILSYSIKASLVLAIIQEVLLGRWSLIFISLIAVALTFLPAIIDRNHEINLPAEFELAITLFIYAALILGEKHGYYDRFPWWDLFLHGQSGLLLGLVGFLIVYVLYHHNKVKMSPLFVAVFSFSFAIAIGTIWEIFEFLMDVNFGFNMQQSGLVDTMGDLIIDCVGALLAALAGYFYVKGNKVMPVDTLLKKFFKANPKLSA